MATQLDTRDQINTTEETRFSELIRHFDDEVRCEVDHVATNTSCSGDVQGLYRTACRPEIQVLTCQTGVEYVKAAVSRNSKCKCREFVRDCWTVTPI